MAMRKAVLIVSWTAMTKEYLFDVNYGMGLSMSPTIPDGSFIVVERLSRRWRNWERGDLVQLRSPTRCRGETITKRLLALVRAFSLFRDSICSSVVVVVMSCAGG